MIKRLKLWYHALLKIESLLLVALFLTMLIISVIQIILRNIFDMGIVWGDTFLRISVLWLGLMGALVASRNNNHISMNLGQKYLSDKNQNNVKIIIYFFTSGICFIISWFGGNLVLMEYEEAGLAFANIPIWITVLIIPIAFIIMGLRYLAFSLLLLLGQAIDDQSVIK
ncbi:MAG: TRAP transporter small permease subunit [Gammaproteobacteria bacterium]|nr:TRAP transporter small permease subunit [Gammaproteobacteria bacterium]